MPPLHDLWWLHEGVIFLLIRIDLLGLFLLVAYLLFYFYLMVAEIILQGLF